MKKIFRALAIVTLALSACRTSPPAIPKPSPAPSRTAPHPFDVAWDDRSVFRKGLIGAEQAALDRLPGATVYHIALQISDDLLLLQGREEVRYTNQEDEPLDEVYFRLFPNMAGGEAAVSAVEVGGLSVDPVYEFQDSAIRVELPVALQPGEQVNIQMDFEVEVAREMAGNYGLFGYFGGVLVLDEFYPVIPAYDDEGWNVEVPPSNGDVTHFDASFYLVRVTAPDDLTIIASGTEVGREYEENSQVLTFAAGPARDFYIAASKHYAVVSETVGETVVNSYTFADRGEGAELALQFATGALESFNERFGVYPYAEFDVVSTPMQALGMEYPGVVAISLDLYEPDVDIYGVPSEIMLEGTVVHEVGHQWFYNVVGNDQIDEPWLDEAIVQYITGLYYADAYSESAAQSWRNSWHDRWERVDRADIPIGMPAGDYVDNEYGAIVYGRGPIFIATLAEEMGQGDFDEFLRDYYQSHKWAIGTGSAFIQLAEQHCQCDLTDLFVEWVYGEIEAVPVAPEAPDPAATETVDSQPSADDLPDEDVINGWAVLAEKDDYSDVDMTDLPVDYINIAQLRQVLVDSGWQEDHIREWRGFDREDLQKALDWLADVADENDVVFFYVAGHGTYLRETVGWSDFFAADWAEVTSQRRVLVVETCQAAILTAAVEDDPHPYLSVAAVDEGEYGWAGLEEEGLPIIGSVFTHYFATAFTESAADADRNGAVSVQEAALWAEAQQRTYMHEVVFAVPEFLEMYQGGGAHPENDAGYPHVVVDDKIGEPVYLALHAHPASGVEPQAGDPFTLISQESLFAFMEDLTAIQPYSGWRNSATEGEAEALDYVTGQLEGFAHLQDLGLGLERQSFHVFQSTELWETRLHLTVGGQEVEVPADGLRGPRDDLAHALRFDSDGTLNDAERNPAVVEGPVVLVRSAEASAALDLAGKVVFLDYALVDRVVQGTRGATSNAEALLAKGPAGLVLVTQFSNTQGESHGFGVGDISVFNWMETEPPIPTLYARLEDLSPAGIASWDDLTQVEAARLTWDADVFSPGTSENLVARIPGVDSSQAVILGAHIDSPNSPGAMDDGSGSVVLLETARVLNAARVQPPVDLYLVWFGSEELGLYGSAHFAATHQELLDRTLAMLQIDCLIRPLDGISADLDLVAWSYARLGDDRLAWPDYLSQAAARQGVETFPQDIPHAYSDNSVFNGFDVPNADLIYENRQALEAAGGFHYAAHIHSPYDTVELAREVGDALEQMARVVLVAALETGRESPTLRVAPQPDRRALFVASHTEPVHMTPASFTDFGMALAWEGFDVDLIPYGQAVTSADLENTDLVVVLPVLDYPGPDGDALYDEDWSQEEVIALETYVAEGGLLVLTNSAYRLKYGGRALDQNEDWRDVNALAERFGVSYRGGTLYATKAWPAGGKPLMEDVTSLALADNNCVPFDLTGGQTLAWAGGEPAIALVDYGEGGQVLALADVSVLATVGGEPKNLDFWLNLARYARSR
jgi:hypothetical protein